MVLIYTVETFPLPLRNFVTLENYELHEILETSDKTHMGFVLDVDLENPTELLDLHKDFQLAHTKKFVAIIWLGVFRPEFKDRMPYKTMKKTNNFLQTSYETLFDPVHHT